jgi:hypothetical protein
MSFTPVGIMPMGLLFMERMLPNLSGLIVLRPAAHAVDALLDIKGDGVPQRLMVVLHLATDRHGEAVKLVVFHKIKHVFFTPCENYEYRGR